MTLCGCVSPLFKHSTVPSQSIDNAHNIHFQFSTVELASLHIFPLVQSQMVDDKRSPTQDATHSTHTGYWRWAVSGQQIISNPLVGPHCALLYLLLYHIEHSILETFATSSLSMTIHCVDGSLCWIDMTATSVSASYVVCAFFFSSFLFVPSLLLLLRRNGFAWDVGPKHTITYNWRRHMHARTHARIRRHDTKEEKQQKCIRRIRYGFVFFFFLSFQQYTQILKNEKNRRGVEWKHTHTHKRKEIPVETSILTLIRVPLGCQRRRAHAYQCLFHFFFLVGFCMVYVHANPY